MTSGPPSRIFLIRHGEKPGQNAAGDPVPPFGIDLDGNPNPHSLTPRGWQRAGALAMLFAPTVGPPRTGLAVPDRLYGPAGADLASTAARRTSQTLLVISDRTRAAVDTGFDEGDETALAAAVLAGTGNVLICWEHHRLSDIAAAIAAAVPTTPAVPTAWPGGRFDLIWTFTATAGGPTRFTFAQTPQTLLRGDVPDGSSPAGPDA